MPSLLLSSLDMSAASVSLSSLAPVSDISMLSSVPATSPVPSVAQSPCRQTSPRRHGHDRAPHGPDACHGSLPVQHQTSRPRHPSGPVLRSLLSKLLSCRCVIFCLPPSATGHVPSHRFGSGLAISLLRGARRHPRRLIGEIVARASWRRNAAGGHSLRGRRRRTNARSASRLRGHAPASPWHP